MCHNEAKIMNDVNKQQILQDFSTWVRDEFAVAHKANTVKLASLAEFSVNPFLWSYLAYYLNGRADAKSLAEVLILPRVLGTSVNTIFGTRFQQFVTRYFENTFGSTTPGIDIEFIDKVDGRKKYCQLKAGPNVINHDDVISIRNHFGSAKRLARTNNMDVIDTDFMFALLYGEEHQKNGFITLIEKDWPVVIGQEFWYHFTGDVDFYKDLIQTISEIANEFDMKDTVQDTINSLAADITLKYPEIVE